MANKYSERKHVLLHPEHLDIAEKLENEFGYVTLSDCLRDGLMMLYKVKSELVVERLRILESKAESDG